MMNDEIRDICYAIFDGNATDEERLRVEQWLHEESENRAEYDGLIEECLRVRWAYESRAMDPAAAAKIGEAIRKRGRRRSVLRYVSVASTAAVAALVVWLALPGGGETIAQEAGLISGNVEITLSDGSTVSLADAKGEIEERDGWRIGVNDDGELEYRNVDGAAVSENGIINKVTVPRGAQHTLRLGDGTLVTLNAASSIEYRVPFPDTGTRAVELTGEAYFDVATDRARPFIVNSGDFSLRVHGTGFNLNTRDREAVELVLVEGSVGFTGAAGVDERMLVPGERAVVDKRTGLSEIERVDVQPYVAWRDGEIVFVDEPLSRMMERLALWYDVDVVFENEAVGDLRFDMNVPKYEKITSLFYYMEKITDVRFRLDGRTVYVGVK